jgi:DNA-binding CsgD family transcriptional regulator
LIDLYRENGFYNGYSIVSENEGTNESTFFVTKNDDTHIKDFYKNHSSVLDSFLDHFKSIAPDIFDLTDESKLGFSPYVNETYPKIEKIFLKSTPWERILDNFSASLESQFNDEIETIMKIHSLTKREVQCLILLSRGDTGKEVARKLNLSPRTVESHINNLRVKTNRQTKIEIIHWFKEVFKPFLNDKSSRINSTFCCNI